MFGNPRGINSKDRTRKIPHSISFVTGIISPRIFAPSMFDQKVYRWAMHFFTCMVNFCVATLRFRPLKILRKILNGYVAWEENDYIFGISRIFSSSLSLHISCVIYSTSFKDEASPLKLVGGCAPRPL